jgi:hypothetical protein
MAVHCSCAPDDGCKYHPKHVELKLFQERNKAHSTSSWNLIKAMYPMFSLNQIETKMR